MIAADTNLLARAVLGDDPVQAPAARRVLGEAESIFISGIVLCELVWVLQRRKWSGDRIAEAIQLLVTTDNVMVDGLMAQAGLAFLRQGGDFADGVIRHEAVANGCDETLTFDQDFARLGAPDVTLIS